MKKNVFMKVFFSSVVWTAVCLGLAAVAASKAEQQDPDILQKVAAKIESNSNVHVSFGGAHSRDFIAAEDSWTFKTPSEAIEIKTVNGDVEIISAKAGSPIVVTAKGRRHKTITKLLVTTATQNVVSLEQPDDDTTRELKVHISLPEDFKGKLSVKTVNGDTDLNTLTLNTLDVQSVSGDVHVRNSAVKKIRQSSVSGDVVIDNKIRSNLDLESVSGDFKLNLAKSEKTKFQLRTLSGEIKSSLKDDPQGDMTVKVMSTSGDIEIRD